MNHDDTLDAAGLPRTEVLAKRILRTFDRAMPHDLEAGARWYDDAYALASMLAPHLDNDLDRAAEVISALSPRTHWSVNVARATALVLHGDTEMHGLRSNMERAVRIMKGERLADVTKGPKTQAFARNIAGDREAVTVDVWSCYVAGVDPEGQLARKGVYDAVAHAYRVAARRRGVDPSTMQAVTWVVGRRQGMSEQRRNR